MESSLVLEAAEEEVEEQQTKERQRRCQGEPSGTPRRSPVPSSLSRAGTRACSRLWSPGPVWVWEWWWRRRRDEVEEEEVEVVFFPSRWQTNERKRMLSLLNAKRKPRSVSFFPPPSHNHQDYLGMHQERDGVGDLVLAQRRGDGRRRNRWHRNRRRR